MKTINKKTLKGKWYKFPEDKDIEVLVRPFSVFSMTKPPSADATEINITDFYENFAYVLLDWKGIVDEDKKPLKCNDENKKIVYDFIQELSGFVVESSIKMRDEAVSNKEAKN